jgi:two-component system sensor histidine kinase PhoQ
VSVAAELSGQVLQLRIDDDGPGVPPHRRDDILQRGVRLDTRAEGQGFGLAITADIVASYNGRISITESQWGGARFDICLR